MFCSSNPTSKLQSLALYFDSQRIIGKFFNYILLFSKTENEKVRKRDHKNKNSKLSLHLNFEIFCHLSLVFSIDFKQLEKKIIVLSIARG